MKLHIASIADVHSPRYLPLFFASINLLKISNQRIDLIVLAGDIVERNSIDNMKPVVSILSKLSDKDARHIPMVATFGNEEYVGFEDRYRRMFPEILWLDDEHTIIRTGNAKLCIVGSRGVLKKPTTWQRKNIPDIDRMYSNRLKKIKELLEACREYELSILVTHYVSTYMTLQGELPQIYDFLGYPLIENMNTDLRPNIVIHGHAHNSTKTYTIINDTKIYNVSLPATKHITLIDVSI